MPKDITRLIPIKKPVVDLHRGLIVRTYYYAPEKLTKQLEKLKEEPNINYFTITPLYNEYETYLKTGDISQYSKIFNQKDWKVITNINKEQIENYNINTENNFISRVYSLLFTGEKIFTKGIKQESKNYSKVVNAYITQDIIKPKKRKKKKESLKDIFSSDKPKTKIKLVEQKVYDPSRSASIISNIINFFNPKKPKLERIVKSFIGSDYIDESMIIHHCVFSERSLHRIPELSINLIKSTINVYNSIKYQSKLNINYIEFYLPYMFVELLKLNVMEFKNTINTYSNNKYINDIVGVLNGNKISDDSAFLYAQVVALPKAKLMEMVKNTIMSNDKNYKLDYTILRALSNRKDLSVNEFDIIFNRFIVKYQYELFNKENILTSLLKVCFEHTPTLTSTLFEFLASKLFNDFYLPLGKDFRGLEPEVGNFMFNLSSPIYTLQTFEKIFYETFEKYNKSNLKVYIPIISKEDYNVISGEIDTIPFRLLNYHIGVLDENVIKDDYYYIELNLNNNGKIFKYKENDTFVLIGF